MIKGDVFQRFMLDELDVRGELVRLSNSYLDATKTQNYPPSIKNMLGQTIAASLLLTGMLKFSGRLSIHARGEGPLQLLMAEATDQRKFRATANWSGTVEENASVGEMLGSAQLAITIDPEKGARYQGIVPLERETLSDCIAHYFELSEQLDTFMLLGADEKGAYGLMLQKMPGNEMVEDQDGWNRIIQLAKTLSIDELASNDNETLLFRLFHEEKLLPYELESVKFECSCSNERTMASIKTLGKEEALEILESEASISVDCQFCGEHYDFGRDDINQLFDLGATH